MKAEVVYNPSAVDERLGKRKAQMERKCDDYN